mmetsp:Transcript_23725/g.42429  ORF Transcript_23725/g.42429 Transcript_23725/m.42429 type:complete len:238 (-) Transcript_23725:879-1592(-)
MPIFRWSFLPQCEYCPMTLHHPLPRNKRRRPCTYPYPRPSTRPIACNPPRTSRDRTAAPRWDYNPPNKSGTWPTRTREGRRNPAGASVDWSVRDRRSRSSTPLAARRPVSPGASFENGTVPIRPRVPCSWRPAWSSPGGAWRSPTRPRRRRGRVVSVVAWRGRIRSGTTCPNVGSIVATRRRMPMKKHWSVRLLRHRPEGVGRASCWKPRPRHYLHSKVHCEAVVPMRRQHSHCWRP